MEEKIQGGLIQGERKTVLPLPMSKSTESPTDPQNCQKEGEGMGSVHGFGVGMRRQDRQEGDLRISVTPKMTLTASFGTA